MTRKSNFAQVFADIAAQEDAQGVAAVPAPTPEPEVPVRQLPPRMLGGRVPDPVFRQFNRHKEDAEIALGVTRVNTDTGIEALVRLLDDEGVKARWVEEVKRLRAERLS